jgi:hypothetical protein
MTIKGIDGVRMGLLNWRRIVAAEKAAEIRGGGEERMRVRCCHRPAAAP